MKVVDMETVSGKTLLEALSKFQLLIYKYCKQELTDRVGISDDDIPF
jgi:hypothetical protein